jgi:hypothetical protein
VATCLDFPLPPLPLCQTCFLATRRWQQQQVVALDEPFPHGAVRGREVEGAGHAGQPALLTRVERGRGGIGEKLVNHKPTGVSVLKFLVRAKYPESQMGAKYLPPKAVDGIPADVEEVGLFRRFATQTPIVVMPNPRLKIRPAQTGCSVGFQSLDKKFVMAGTLGGHWLPTKASTSSVTTTS